MPSRRERLREATLLEIKQTARQQMAEQGSAAISLRAIAAQIGIAAPSLYNYFKSRDDLLTALIVDTFQAQAEHLEAADLSQPPQDYAARFRATCLAYRDWNLSHPLDFRLIVGQPIPGYQPPLELTTPAGRRTLAVFVGIFQAAWQAGQVRLPGEYAGLSAELEEQLAEFVRRENFELALPVLHLTLTAWAQLLGLLSLEIYGHFQPVLSDPGALYRYEVEAFIQKLGLAGETARNL